MEKEYEAFILTIPNSELDSVEKIIKHRQGKILSKVYENGIKIMVSIPSYMEKELLGVCKKEDIGLYKISRKLRNIMGD